MRQTHQDIPISHINSAFNASNIERDLLDATPTGLSYTLRMKFDVLRSIGHNIAASLASGDSILTGGYISPYAELERNPDGFIYVNFLTGTSNSLSPCFKRGVARFGEALPALCQKHGTSPSAFRRLEAKYISDAASRRFLVMVEDQQGRSSTDIYVGHGARLRVLDPAGRIQKMRGAVTRTQSQK